MKMVLKGFLRRIFNWRSPKAWGSLLTVIAALAVKYLPFGSEVIAFIKSNPEEFIAAAGALAGGLGLLNQQSKTQTEDALNDLDVIMQEHTTVLSGTDEEEHTNE